MDTGKLRRLAELYGRRKDLEEQVKVIADEEDTLNAELVEDFIQDGAQSVKLDGRTFFLHRQLWAKAAADPQEAVKALAAINMPECLMMGTQRVSGMIRDLGEEEFFQKYPELRNVISTETRSSVRIRKS